MKGAVVLLSLTATTIHHRSLGVVRHTSSVQLFA